MQKPKALIIAGFGINCEGETKFAFEKAGAHVELVHVNDIIEKPKMLNDYQIMAFPGGFSFGDDTGSGNALANKIRDNLWNELMEFIDQKKLVIGICNGFQVLVNLGLLPAIDNKYGERQVALVHNNNARYTVRWVDVEFDNRSPWLKDIGRISLPIAHGEGKFYADRQVLEHIKNKELIAARYFKGDICEYQNLEANPNGALYDIAGITDESGRVLGMMPHPERAINFTHLPNWTSLREKYRRDGIEIPSEGPGIKLFLNGVNYFK